MANHRRTRPTWPLALPVLSSRGAEQEFTGYADALLGEWLERQRLPTKRRAYSPNAWFKREAYRLLSHFLEAGQAALFESVALKDSRPNRLVQEAMRNPFKLGLLAMFSDESSLTRQDRNVFGNQMLFAWAHDVPYDFLNAFLAVTGGPSEVSRKLRERETEPGFEHRFRPDRLEMLD